MNNHQEDDLFQDFHKSGTEFIELPQGDQERLERIFAKYTHQQLLAIRDLIVVLGQQRNMVGDKIKTEERMAKATWHYCPWGCEQCEENIIGLTQ